MADSFEVPRLDQYFGMWAVEESRFFGQLREIERLDLGAHISRNAGPRSRRSMRSEGATAIIAVEGTLTKAGSSFGSGADSLVTIRKQVRMARKDPEIGSILLAIDSPGGTVAGTADLAAEVAAANKEKPVFAFVEDLAASAAYWIASQAEEIYANNKTAAIGSIGTYIGLYDLSGAAAAAGIRPVVISSGGMKGAGFPGTEISDEFRGQLQDIVDKTQAEFSGGVASGRKMKKSQVDELADGRVFVASDAVGLGLINGIQSIDKTLAALRRSTRGRKAAMVGGITMETESMRAAASLEDLKICCPGAPSTFLLSHLESGSTLDQARSAWTELLVARLEESEKKAEALEAQNAQLRQELEEQKEATASAPGVDPVGTDFPEGEARESGANAGAEFWRLVKVETDKGRTKAQAISKVSKGHPELREALVAAANA